MSIEPTCDAEQRLLEAHQRAKPVDLGPGDPVTPGFDPAAWSPDRVVRSEFLRSLLLDAETPEAGHARLVSLAGAWITGQLRLGNLILAGDLDLHRCYVAEPVILTNTTGHGLAFAQCRIPEIAASGLQCGQLTLDGIHTGQVDLRRAQVRGDLRLDSATIGDESRVDDPNYVALFADGLTVGGDLVLTRLEAAGQVRVVGARVTGNLAMDQAGIANPAGCAVDASRLIVEGGVYASNAQIAGQLMLTGASIGANVRLLETHLLAGPDGWALRAGGLIVGGHLLARDLRVTGWAGLDSAVIRGTLNLDQMTISPATAEAACTLDLSALEARTVSLRYAHVDAYVRLQRARITGDLNLTNSTVGPTIAATGPHWSGLDADAATVAGTLSLAGITTRGEVSLVDVATDRLDLFTTRLHNAGGIALNASRLSANHGLYASRAQVEGAVELEAARIGDTLELDNCQLTEPPHGLTALNARRLIVDGDVRITNLTVTGSALDIGQARVSGHTTIGPVATGQSPPEHLATTLKLDSCQLESLDLVDVHAEADLSSATVGRLYVFTDSPMWLSGLSYQDLTVGDTARPQAALAWLGQDQAFTPQAYEQLAAFYAGQGRETDARQVRLAARRRQRAQERWYRRLPSLLSDIAAGYGYAPSRAFLWLSACWLLLLAWFAVHRPIPQDPTTSFNPWLYALDLVLPASPFGIEGKWKPQGGIPELLTVVGQAAGYLLTIPALAAVNRAFNRS